MTLVKVRDGWDVTLPEEAREALRLSEGDYLEAEVVGGGVLLKPAVDGKRQQAWDELMAIVNRPKWIGPGPEPTEDELMDEVVEEIHAMRRERDQGRS